MGSTRSPPELAPRRLSSRRGAIARRAATRFAAAARAARFALTMKAQSARYPGTCRERHWPPGNAAIRVRVEPGLLTVARRPAGHRRRPISARPRATTSSCAATACRPTTWPSCSTTPSKASRRSCAASICSTRRRRTFTFRARSGSRRRGTTTCRSSSNDAAAEALEADRRRAGRRRASAASRRACSSCLGSMCPPSSRPSGPGSALAVGARALEHRLAARTPRARTALTPERSRARRRSATTPRRRRACSSERGPGGRPRAP